MANTLPQDSNTILYEGLRDSAGQQFVAKAAGTVSTDGAGIKLAPTLIQGNDGAIATIGALGDGAYTSGSGSVVAILKGLFSKLGTLVTNSPALGQTTMTGSIPVVIASNQSAISVTSGGGSAVDAANSSTSTLGSNAVFTGTSVSALGSNALAIEVFADQNSAAGGLSIQQSEDGSNWDIKDTFTITASTGFSTIVNLFGDFYRIVYTNGSSAQGAFRLQTIKLASSSPLPRTLTSTGNLRVDGSSVTQPISASALPLPTNAAQETGGNLATIVTQTAHANPAGSNTALSSPPGNTNSGSDTSLTFGSAVNHWTLQNNSTANLYYQLDATASTSTFILAPNSQVWWDWPVTVVHVYTTVAIPVNGVAGLVLIGRA